MIDIFGRRSRIADAARKADEAARKKAGCIFVPKDAEKRLQEIVVQSFDWMKKDFADSKYEVDELILKFAARLGEDLLAYFPALVDEWRANQKAFNASEPGKAFKPEHAISQAGDQMAVTFDNFFKLVNHAKQHGKIAIDIGPETTFDRLEQVINMKVALEVRMWR